MLRLRQGLDTRNEGQTLGGVRAPGLGLERGQGRFAFPGQEEKNGGELLLEQRPAMRPSWDRLSGKKRGLGSRSGWWRSALVSGTVQIGCPDPAHWDALSLPGPHRLMFQLFLQGRGPSFHHSI